MICDWQFHCIKDSLILNFSDLEVFLRILQNTNESLRGVESYNRM